jgi:nucleoside-diphosphate-sugar epimerase
MQTILGANGTIGSDLARELRNYTNRIRLVSRNPRKVNENDELFPADLTSPGTIEKAIRGSEVVYLVVGLEYRLSVWQEKWPVLMKSVIDSCIRNRSRLDFFDNVYMYDINSIPHMTESSPENPPSAKGKVRKSIARMLMDSVRSGRLMALIARSADFYGPSNERSFLNEMVYKRMLKGSTPLWIINADKKHSFTFTPDAARATALLGNTSDAYNQVWHLPTDKNALTVRELASLFGEEMNRKGKLMVIPKWMISGLGMFSSLAGEMSEMTYQYDRDYIFDSSKFTSRFNILPTTYRDGVQSIVRG